MRMRKYSKLVEECEGWWKKSRDALPKALGMRIDKEFVPVQWDWLSPKQREILAAQIDWQRDPALENERELVWDAWVGLDEVEKKIALLVEMAVSKPSELEAKDRQLRRLRSARLRYVRCLEGAANVATERELDIYRAVEACKSAGTRSVMKVVAKKHSISDKTVRNIVAKVRRLRGESRSRKKKEAVGNPPTASRESR